ncbi:hypothetical protein AVEN_43982-1 [Araneus ventricosus]|uniref:Mutator-like transposase domain-containing protein n=1 Tax=Araneus ventricosus TaxID=182803 RepID=A0A4Y2M6K0_ARAVE|nr:hypothetical protein AVEN_43982-1 [Araneus ventricosus]
MRYMTLLSDGDVKTHQDLNEIQVYGKNVTILKEEFINHVTKRVGTGLRNVVQDWKKKGVTLGGKKCGSLKDETIKKLRNFYRKAITDNAPDVDKMKSSIFATLHHCMSTDKNPHLSKCPVGKNSFCFYQRALAKNQKPKTHSTMKTPLSNVVVEKIMPVYQRRASTEILNRCTSAKTQNQNESLHGVIWNKCPKEVFVPSHDWNLQLLLL